MNPEFETGMHSLVTELVRCRAEARDLANCHLLIAECFHGTNILAAQWS
jgi:hypothetical protein